MQLTDDQLANSCGPLLGLFIVSFVAEQFTLDVKMLNITGVELMMSERAAGQVHWHTRASDRRAI
jgi:hypothetical protein